MSSLTLTNSRLSALRTRLGMLSRRLGARMLTCLFVDGHACENVPLIQHRFARFPALNIMAISVQKSGEAVILLAAAGAAAFVATNDSLSEMKRTAFGAIKGRVYWLPRAAETLDDCEPRLYVSPARLIAEQKLIADYRSSISLRELFSNAGSVYFPNRV